MFWIAWSREDGEVDLINVSEEEAVEEAAKNNPREVIFEAELVTE